MRLRDETPADEAFLLSLFAADRSAVLASAGLSGDPLTAMLTMQRRAQTLSYRGRFPDARFLVADLDGASVGRLVLARTEDALHIVDIAVDPVRRRTGLAARILSLPMAEARAGGLGLTARVERDNHPSLALFRALGFREEAHADPGALLMRYDA